MTEDQFLQSILAVAKAAHWTPFHILDNGNNRRRHALADQARDAGNDELADALSRPGHARVTARGYPDLTLRHSERGVIIAELKSDRRSSKPTTEQWEWLMAFKSSMTPPDNPCARYRVHLWRPKDWPAIETQFGLAVPPTHCACPVCQHETPPLQKAA